MVYWTSGVTNIHVLKKCILWTLTTNDCVKTLLEGYEERAHKKVCVCVCKCVRGNSVY